MSQDGLYPIHVAALLGDHDMVSMLIEAQVDVEQRAHGRSALDMAEAENRHLALHRKRINYII